MKTRSLLRRSSPCFLVAAWALTFASSVRAEDASQSAAALSNGVDSDSSQDAVVLLFRPDGSETTSQCTGTLLAPNLVITARHCLSDTAATAYGCDSAGVGDPGGEITADAVPSSVNVFVGNQFPDDPNHSDFHGAAIFHDGAHNLCNHDLALLQLDHPVSNIRPAAIRLDSIPPLGASLTAVGWGSTDATSQPLVRQQRSNLRVVSVGPAAEEVVLASHAFATTSAVCVGDSGGPAFDGSTGALVGVASAGVNRDDTAGGACPSGWTIYEELAPFRDVILEAYRAAGAEPLLEVSGPVTVPSSRCDGGASCPPTEQQKNSNPLGCAFAPTHSDASSWVVLVPWLLILWWMRRSSALASFVVSHRGPWKRERGEE